MCTRIRNAQKLICVNNEGLERNMLVGLAQGAARWVGPSVNKEDAQTHLPRISPF